VGDWVDYLRRGEHESAWDLFIIQYRRLVFATIRHFARDHDDVMDVFAHVCGALQKDKLAKLRKYVDDEVHRARFSTWLVAVVQNLTVDWFRARDGRHRPPAFVSTLPSLQRAIFDYVFVEQRGHMESYESLHAGNWPELSYREFLQELRVTYRAVAAAGGGSIWRGSAPPAPQDSEDSAENPIDARLSYERALAALAALPPEDRLAVQLYVVDELSAQEVARILGLPNAKAVYNRVYRALAAVRAELEDAGVRRADL
jgi:RNA polymerase sigma factor (sigma-70 family)